MKLKHLCKAHAPAGSFAKKAYKTFFLRSALPKPAELTTPLAWLKQHLAFNDNFTMRVRACQNLRTRFKKLLKRDILLDLMQAGLLWIIDDIYFSRVY